MTGELQIPSFFRWVRLLVAAFLMAFAPLVHGQIYISTSTGAGGETVVGGVGEYGLDGSVINQNFIQDYGGIGGMATDGAGNLFLTTVSDTLQAGDLAEFNSSGQLVNEAKIPPLIGAMAYANGDIFICVSGKGTVEEFSSSGKLLNASFITGLGGPDGIATDGDGNLFVSSENGTVGEYMTSGAVVNAQLVTGLYDPGSITFDGKGDLLVSDYNQPLSPPGQFQLAHLQIGKYTVSGETVNASFIQNAGGLLTMDGNGDLFIAEDLHVAEYNPSGSLEESFAVPGSGFAGITGIVVMPEPSIWLLLSFGTLAVALSGQNGLSGRRGLV